MTQQLPDEGPTIAAAIIVADGRVLLVRRRQSEGSLLWAFPGGRVEPGETAEYAAAREAKEEVGLEVKPIKTLGERVHPATGRKMVYVACEIIRGTPGIIAEDELAGLVWAEHAQLTEYVPHGFMATVQNHLDAVLPHQRNGAERSPA
ncbi:NUDIX domain-containing protein [Actinopolymorpha sp. B11F2]|uniref:NUDIX hydrolase n=1 Tax=Actinopolymorpha sp. B11F2 TaxID=3160862 RepID=UPI0032E4D480